MNLTMFLGGLIGYAIARWDGLLAGLLIGYFVPRLFAYSLAKGLYNATLGRVQTDFLDSAFAVMGAVCKADGRVTKDEIRVAERLFDQFHLNSDARERARNAFNRGKSPHFDLDREIAAFARASHGQRVLHQIFMQVQLSAVTADGALHASEYQLLLRIARGLGFSAFELEQLEALLHGQMGDSHRQAYSHRSDLADAYAILGVSPQASSIEIKSAYRRLMNQNHPDKLAAKGLPESMRDLAERKTRDITSAYQLITRTRASGG